MDVAVLTAVATLVMAMPAMLWHQHRAILKQLGENGERLARIEGFLGIGIPRGAAPEPPGGSWPPDGPEKGWTLSWT